MNRLIAPLLLASTLAAQTSIELQLPERRGMRSSDKVFTQIMHVPAPSRLGGQGFTRILFQNRSAAKRVIDVRLQLLHGRTSNFRVDGHLELDGEETGLLFLPVPYHQSPMRYEIEVDGFLWESRRNRFPSHVANAAVSALCIAESAQLGVAWKNDLTTRLSRLPRSKRSRRGRSAPLNLGYQQIEARDVPDRWPLLSGFDIIVVDANSEQLNEQHQATLANYAAGGGRLIVLNHATLPEGPLYSALEEIASQRGSARGGGTLVGSFDFGSILAFGDAGESLHNRVGADDPKITDWFVRPATGALRASERGYSGPMDWTDHQKLQIPGLGGVPVRMFFFLIFGFAILVGPVNWTIFVKRRKQPLMLLATIPLSGLGFAFLILSWGVISEGFGLQGNIRSLILLDQRDHRATVQSTRTIYAGLSPAKLALRADTYISSDAFPRNYSTSVADRFIDSNGQLGGGSLPSRVQVTFATMSRSRARDRLRFKRSGDGLSVLSDPSFAPIRGNKRVLLRDFDGKHWISDTKGNMTRASAREAASLQRAFSADYLTTPTRNNNHFITHSTPRFIPPWQELIVGPLEPGTYLAWVGGFAGEDDFGLEVEYEAFSRLVRGTLAEEDIN